MCFYRQQDMVSAMVQVYQRTPGEMDLAFTDYVRLFRTDEALEHRMADLLRQ